MKVLHVLTRAHRRGAETFGLELHQELLARGTTSHIVALAPAISGQPLAAPVLGARPRGPLTLRRLRRLAGDADVVVAHGSSTLAACRLALLGSPTPFVYVNIGDPWHWTASWARRVRVRWMLTGAAAVGAISPTARERLITHLGVPADRVWFTGNGRRPEQFPPPTPATRADARARFGLGHGPVALMVAALSPEKRVDVAIEALAGLPDWRLLVVGDGPLRAELQARAQRQGADRVIFTGTLSEVLPAYHAADVALLTSATEGLPGVLIEAALCGLPIVATDVGFVRDIVQDGCTGRLVPVGDVSGTATALLQAAEHRAPWGNESRRHALEQYSLSEVVERWQRLLMRTVTARGH